MTPATTTRNLFASDLFKGLTALVTGGGSGIGLRIASDFLRYGGDRLAILGRDKEKLETARQFLVERQSLTGSTADVLCLVCNIREEEEVERSVSELAAHWNRVDILVNNAGGQFPSSSENIRAKGFKAVVETNLNGTFHVSRACFSHFFKHRGGCVVNMLMDNRSGMPLMPHSAAARAGVENLTKSWAIEWAHLGVRVNAVAPGIIRSGGLDTYAPEFRAQLEKMQGNNYAYRFGSEAEVSAAVLFLASRASSYTTGITLAVDGGESIFNPFLPPRLHMKLPAFED